MDKPEVLLATLLDEDATARILKVSIKTLQGWRQQRRGPRYFKLSNRVRYSADDLRAYLAQCVVEPTVPPERAR
jgi:helix-turn-helix protein